MLFPGVAVVPPQPPANGLHPIRDAPEKVRQSILADEKRRSGTIARPTATDWANELHPGNDGFRALADKFDAALQANL